MCVRVNAQSSKPFQEDEEKKHANITCETIQGESRVCGTHVLQHWYKFNYLLQQPYRTDRFTCSATKREQTPRRNL